MAIKQHRHDEGLEEDEVAAALEDESQVDGIAEEGRADQAVEDPHAGPAGRRDAEADERHAADREQHDVPGEERLVAEVDVHGTPR
ncbi:hypothetical protein [Streptacidiphilus sp. PAMC 29251]